MKSGLKAAFHTLGCKVNQQETAAIEAAFAHAGFCVVSFQSNADVYVINSCVVTAQAERKSVSAVRRIRNRAPQALIVLAGCFPQVAGQRVMDSGADIVVGSNDKSRIVQLVLESIAGRKGRVFSVTRFENGAEFERISDGTEPDRKRAFLKVQDGCRQFCTYCIIPFARGPERSLPQAEVVSQAADLVKRGYREIVLTGIHLGAYGRDLREACNLTSLAAELLAATEVERLRFGSLEPNDIDDDLIRLMGSSPRICRHLHIPLQSGCDRTLSRMGRRYSVHDYAVLLGKLRREMPFVGITTDVIAGFPGESEEDHLISEHFLREMAPLRTHVFRFSRRSGTPAAEMEGQVRESTRAERATRLTRVAEESARKNHQAYVGQRLSVLVEACDEEMLVGHSSEYVNVTAEGPPGLVGSVICVLAESAGDMGVQGRLLQE